MAVCRLTGWVTSLIRGAVGGWGRRDCALRIAVRPCCPAPSRSPIALRWSAPMITLVLAVVVCFTVAVTKSGKRPAAVLRGPGSPSESGRRVPRALLMVIKTGGVVVAAGAFTSLAGQTAGAQESGNDAIDTYVAAAAGQQLKTDLDAGSGSLEAGDSTGSAAGTDTAEARPTPPAMAVPTVEPELTRPAGDFSEHQRHSATALRRSCSTTDPLRIPHRVRRRPIWPVAGSAAASPADAGQPATAPASDGSTCSPRSSQSLQSAPHSAAADLVSVESSQNSAGGSQVADPAAETGGSAAGTDASDVPADVAENLGPAGRVGRRGISHNTASANTASASPPSANTASANTALAGPQSNPAVGDAGTSGNWSLDLLGAGTLFSDGLFISLQWPAPTPPSPRSCSTRIYSIVVNGRSSANALTIAGPLAPPLTFVGGGNDKRPPATGGNTIRFTYVSPGRASPRTPPIRRR